MKDKEWFERLEQLKQDNPLLDLIHDWCMCLDDEQRDKIIKDIAVLTGCLNENVPNKLTHEQRYKVIKWIEIHHNDLYLIATGQLNE